jgi:hypothetical protein
LCANVRAPGGRRSLRPGAIPRSVTDRFAGFSGASSALKKSRPSGNQVNFGYLDMPIRNLNCNVLAFYRLGTVRRAPPVSPTTTSASNFTRRLLTRICVRANLAVQNLVDNSISRPRLAAHRLETSWQRASLFPRNFSIFLCALRRRVRLGDAALAYEVQFAGKFVVSFTDKFAVSFADLGIEPCDTSWLTAEPSICGQGYTNRTCRSGGHKTL